jgi:hypothetical protein
MKNAARRSCGGGGRDVGGQKPGVTRGCIPRKRVLRVQNVVRRVVLQGQQAAPPLSTRTLIVITEFAYVF